MDHPLVGQTALIARLKSNWATFQAKRNERMIQAERFGASEKVAENIIEDFVTIALDWELGQSNNQVERADIVLTRLGIKYLLIEAKRPGALASKQAIEKALGQAAGYAHEQHVKCIAVSDGTIIYAADIQAGGLVDRVIARLDSDEPDESLWWLSQHGIYRTRPDRPSPLEFPGAGRVSAGDHVLVDGTDELLHPKYKRPARCFAYVGDQHRFQTWSLPYLNVDGSVDMSKLPAAIGCVVRNYRGQVVKKVPESAVPEVLVRLGKAAKAAGKLPASSSSADTYKELQEVLVQLDKLKDVGVE